MNIRPETDTYQIQLSDAAAARGDRVFCQHLGWQGTDNNLARVRITHSTLPRYRYGRIGLVERERLIPVRASRAA